MESTITIIIPTYNRANRLIQTIHSVTKQRYPNFELIIVDDGSTDNTSSVVKSFTDNRIHYFYKPNEERAIARNFGISKAKGNYITFLDSDDGLYPHFLEEAASLIREKDNPEWLHLAYEIIDEKGKILRRENQRLGNINQSLLTGNHLSCIGVFLRKDIAKTNPFNQDPDIIGSEDYLLWLQLSRRYTLHYSNRISAYITQHSDRSVTGFDSQKLQTRVDKSIFYIQQMGFNNQELKIIKAHRYLYLALHLAMAGSKLKSAQALKKSLQLKPELLLSRKFLAILRRLVVSS